MLDDGPILGQARVPVLPGDTEASLAARVLVQEHRLYPAVLRRFAAGDRTPRVSADALSFGRDLTLRRSAAGTLSNSVAQHVGGAEIAASFPFAHCPYSETCGMPPRDPDAGRRMQTITTTEDLAAFCEAAKPQPYVTIDTEFLRERTYWSKLCLIQMALPGKTGDAVLVDPIEGRGHVDGAALRSVPPRGDGEGVPRRAAGSGDLLRRGQCLSQAAVRHAGRGDGLRLWRAGRATRRWSRRSPRKTSTRPRASPTGRAGR